jgi:hypothetical protein
MIDPDVSIGGRKVTYLHWLSPNVDLSEEKAVVPITGANIVKYFQPSPPAIRLINTRFSCILSQTALTSLQST